MLRITCAMSALAKIDPACILALLLRAWPPCAIWPSPSFIAVAPFRLPLLGGISLLIHARLSPSFFKGGLPSNNSQTLRDVNTKDTVILSRQQRLRSSIIARLYKRYYKREPVASPPRHRSPTRSY